MRSMMLHKAVIGKDKVGQALYHRLQNKRILSCLPKKANIKNEAETEKEKEEDAGHLWNVRRKIQLIWRTE